jgi:hypothetical protein
VPVAHRDLLRCRDSGCQRCARAALPAAHSALRVHGARGVYRERYVRRVRDAGHLDDAMCIPETRQPGSSEATAHESSSPQHRTTPPVMAQLSLIPPATALTLLRPATEGVNRLSPCQHATFRAGVTAHTCPAPNLRVGEQCAARRRCECECTGRAEARDGMRCWRFGRMGWRALGPAAHGSGPLPGAGLDSAEGDFDDVSSARDLRRRRAGRDLRRFARTCASRLPRRYFPANKRRQK